MEKVTEKILTEKWNELQFSVERKYATETISKLSREYSMLCEDFLKQDEIQHINTKSDCVYIHLPSGDILNIHSINDDMYITIWSSNDTLKETNITAVTKEKITMVTKNQIVGNAQRKIIYYGIISKEENY